MFVQSSKGNHLGIFYTWVFSTLGYFLHLGFFYTWVFSTLGYFLHSRNMFWLYGEKYEHVASFTCLRTYRGAGSLGYGQSSFYSSLYHDFYFSTFYFASVDVLN